MTSIQLVVLTWIVVQSGFLGFAVRGLLVARTDRLEAERAHDLEAAAVVETREKRSALRIIAFTAKLAIGIYFIAETNAGPGAIILVVGLFVSTFGFGGEDIVDAWDRARFHREFPARPTA